MLSDLIDPFLAANDDSRLRTAEQFVPAEGHEVCPLCHNPLGPRFGRHGDFGVTEIARFGQQSRSQIDEERNSSAFGQGREFCLLRLGGESDDCEVGSMDGQNGSGSIRDRLFVVACVDLVGRADFDEFGTRFAHDVGHPEAASDLDELASRNDDLTAPAVCREHDQNGARAVVENETRLAIQKRRQ